MANLVSATFDWTERAICQSSNKLGYSSGSAKESAAFWLTCKRNQMTGQGTSQDHADFPFIIVVIMKIVSLEPPVNWVLQYFLSSTGAESEFDLEGAHLRGVGYTPDWFFRVEVL